MNTIVLDLEWNQSSTGKEPEVSVLPFEIVEIGAIKLSGDFRMIGEFTQLVKPQVYHTMHTYTSKLIHLQMKELEKGEPFGNAAEKFLDWCGEDYRLCIWGSSDLTVFQQNLAFYAMCPLRKGPIPYLDAQKLFTLAYGGDLRKRSSLEGAVDDLGVQKDIPFHRAFGDAYYTAKILARVAEEHPEVLKYISYDVALPPESKDEEVYADFGTYTKYISRVFPSRESALSDQEVAAMQCCLCDKGLRMRVPWFSTNGRHYYAIATCEKHGYLKGKTRLKKYGEDGTFVVKTTKFVGTDTMKEIEKKYHRAKERHRP